MTEMMCLSLALPCLGVSQKSTSVSELNVPSLSSLASEIIY